VPWAHLDIAGPARAGGDDGYVAKGGTGFGVRTIVELAERFTKPTKRPAAKKVPSKNKKKAAKKKRRVTKKQPAKKKTAKKK